MPTFTYPQEKTMFRLTLENMGIDLDAYTQKVVNYVDGLRAQGFSPEEIVAALEADQKNSIGVFADLRGSIEKQIDVAMNRMFQISSNEPVGESSELVHRVLDPAAEHCDTCVYLANLPPMPISEIEYPGMQTTHGETNCGSYCACTIEAVP